MADFKYKPIVQTQDGKGHQTLPDGAALDYGFIDNADLVSETAGNLLKTDTAEGQQGKLIVTLAAGLGIVLGTGGILSIDADALVSGKDGNLITSTVDGRLYAHVEPKSLLSTDENNELTLGSDLKLYLKGAGISSDEGNLIKRGVDMGAFLSAELLIANASTTNVLTSNDKGLLQVDIKDIQERLDFAKYSAGSGIKISDAGVISVDYGDGLALRSDGKLIVSYGSGLTISRFGELMVDQDAILTVPADEGMLSYTSGQLTSTIAAAYDSTTGYFTLLGKNGKELSKVLMPGAAQALYTVEQVTNPSGQPAGTYFKYTFKTATGESVVFVPVPDLTAIKAGQGISITQDGFTFTIAPKLKLGGGIAASAEGLYIADEYAVKASDFNALKGRVESQAAALQSLETTTQTHSQQIGALQSDVQTATTAANAAQTTAASAATQVAQASAASREALQEALAAQTAASSAASTANAAQTTATQAKVAASEALSEAMALEGSIKDLDDRVTAIEEEGVAGSSTTIATSEPTDASMANGSSVIYPAASIFS